VAIIAPGFGEIFYANCFNNGIAAVTLDGTVYQHALAAAERGALLTVDIEGQRVEIPGQPDADFEIAAHHRHALLEGLDQTDHILKHDSAAIAAFEKSHARDQPWLNLTAAQLADIENV